MSRDLKKNNTDANAIQKKNNTPKKQTNKKVTNTTERVEIKTDGMICGLLASGTHSGDWGITGRQSCPPPHLSCRSTNKYVVHVDRLPLIIRCIVKLCHTYAYTGRIVDVRTVCVDVGTSPSSPVPPTRRFVARATSPFRHRDLTFRLSRQQREQSREFCNFIYTYIHTKRKYLEGQHTGTTRTNFHLFVKETLCWKKKKK